MLVVIIVGLGVLIWPPGSPEQLGTGAKALVASVYSAAVEVVVEPTDTPSPTDAPDPMGTPYPAQTTLPIQTPQGAAPTYTPDPTPTTFPTPRPTLESLLPRLHDTQNARWLAQAYPDIAQHILAFPWVRDGLTDLEARAVDDLLFLGAGAIDNLRAVLRLPWAQDAITATEYDLLNHIRVLDYRDTDAASRVIAMPFLESPDATDALALRAMGRLAAEGVLSALVESELFQEGITDTGTTLVAAVGTLYRDADAIRRVLTPGNAVIETASIGTEQTPDLNISIVRTGSQSRPGTVAATGEAVEFVETLMQMPFPTGHVIVVLDDSAVTSGYAGTSYGFAFSYSPEYETRQGTYEWRKLQAGFVHELAHYYWLGHADWIDEGAANTFEYMYGIENGLSRGQLRTKRKHCEVHDLEMLAVLDPAQNNGAYYCNYYLGERLFRELLDLLGGQEFTALLQQLYRVAGPVREAGGTPGIAEVRQAFPAQADIVEKHWSGKMNAPENLPFDEGVDRTSHDVVRWDAHPAYDGHSVTFSGTLLDRAVLVADTIEQARDSAYQSFVLRFADVREFAGFILPVFNGGRSWRLDPGDSIADTYSLGDGTFTITFSFPEALGNPSDYVVVISGYQDAGRTPRLGSNTDTLGYARIRVP